VVAVPARAVSFMRLWLPGVLIAVAVTALVVWVGTTIDSSRFAAGLLGAVLGALAGDFATGTANLLIAPRIDEHTRRQVRSERALEATRERLDPEEIGYESQPALLDPSDATGPA
jgi:hypothetical protein